LAGAGGGLAPLVKILFGAIGVGWGVVRARRACLVGKGEPGHLDAFRPVEWLLVAEKCYV